ncbi:hypothetical protein STEG23_027828, partial [Scotinomys teguina]
AEQLMNSLRTFPISLPGCTGEVLTRAYYIIVTQQTSAMIIKGDYEIFGSLSVDNWNLNPPSEP